MKKLLSLFLILGVLLCGCTKQNNGFYRCITQEDAKKMMDEQEDIIILDVRTDGEFKSGHIKNAICLPVSEIKDTPPKELPDLDQVILVYCRAGNRSKVASQALANMGYTNIYEFGGIETWTYGVVYD